jgi:hypothetical protein
MYVENWSGVSPPLAINSHSLTDDDYLFTMRIMTTATG